MRRFSKIVILIVSWRNELTVVCSLGTFQFKEGSVHCSGSATYINNVYVINQIYIYSCNNSSVSYWIYIPEKQEGIKLSEIGATLAF